MKTINLWFKKLEDLKRKQADTMLAANSSSIIFIVLRVCMIFFA